MSCRLRLRATKPQDDELWAVAVLLRIQRQHVFGQLLAHCKTLGGREVGVVPRWIEEFVDGRGHPHPGFLVDRVANELAHDRQAGLHVIANPCEDIMCKPLRKRRT